MSIKELVQSIARLFKTQAISTEDILDEVRGAMSRLSDHTMNQRAEAWAARDKAGLLLDKAQEAESDAQHAERVFARLTDLLA